ncbi:hypothetical protein DFP73DRAFT_546262 [Morchella snyderi]|nr:hypothetical protein DFP73DRAFT_546262 [Morchella snyderi]
MSVFKCSTCPGEPRFNTSQALRHHNHNSTNHSPWPYCKPCSRKFIHEGALESHLDTYHTPREHIRYEINSSGEVRCLTAAQETQFHCCDCGRDFPFESSLDQHLRDKVHTERRPTTLVGFFCKPCKRTFCHGDALAQHMSSLKHRPLVEELKCISGSGCKKVTTSPSAMLHHLESGACISAVNRRKLDRLIKEKDTGSIITWEAGLDGRIHSDYGSDDSSDSEGGNGSEVPSSSVVHVPTPTSSRGGFTTASVYELSIDIEALALTEGELNCPKCPAGSTRRYDTVHALLQHMNSAAHASKSYHCPVILAASGKGTTKSFTTFSGMTQHLESGACKGGKKTFVNAVAFMNQKLKEVGFKEIKLISNS